ncbi:ABC transporter permease, partial [Nocardioides massiliensis]
TVGIGGMAAVERMQGWGRQLGLTPLPDRGFVVVKAFLAVAVAAVPITLIALLGASTGASAEPWTWVVSIGVIMLGATVFALFGLCAGLAFRTEAAVGAASGIMVIMAFLGNLFIPLTGALLTAAKFTPLYGYVALARYPATEGRLIDGRGGLTDSEPLWVPLLNVSVWAAVFGVAAVWLVRRVRGRE